jgi:hypothetical protein
MLCIEHKIQDRLTAGAASLDLSPLSRQSQFVSMAQLALLTQVNPSDLHELVDYGVPVDPTRKADRPWSTNLGRSLQCPRLAASGFDLN